MDLLKENWFSEISEELWPGQSFSLKYEKVLHSEKSDYQDIKILKTTNYGVVLILDGVIQCTERDEFGYQEMISMIPLNCHPSPKRVLIVGGGDGGVAREVLKHPLVEEVYQVEIDKRVVDLSKQFLPFMACGFNDPKLQLTIGDGFEFMKNHKEHFDCIITDSSDEIGPAESLFKESYFSLMKNALKPGGIICSQASTYLLGLEHVKKIMDNCRMHFKSVSYAVTSVPSYPCGQIGFVIGSLNDRFDMSIPITTFSNDEVDRLGFRYYTTNIHKSAFSLPRYAEKILLS